MTVDEFLKDKKSNKCIDKMPSSNEKELRITKICKDLDEAIELEKKLIKNKKVTQYSKKIVHAPYISFYYCVRDGIFLDLPYMVLK